MTMLLYISHKWTARGLGDPGNILGLITSYDLERDLYKIAVRDGVLKGSYTRNQFDVCPRRLLNPADINQDKQISLSLREAVTM